MADTYDLFFGGVPLPRHVAEDNFLFAGQRGSGKTLSLRLLAQSAVDAFTPSSRRKALIYDPKGDWYSITCAIQRGLRYRSRSQVKILNPFDARGYAYDVAADFASIGRRGHTRPLRAVADGFAKALIPTDALGNDNSFWATGAQMVVSALVQSFAKLTQSKRTDGVPNWTLRDLISAACDERLIEAVLKRDPTTARILAPYRKSEKMYASVLQTVATFAWDLEPAATAWDHHISEGRSFTAHDWLKSEDILILCGNYDPPAAVEPINGLIVNFIREHLVSAPEVHWHEPDHPETWFFLDEFPKLHAIRDVQDFFTLTRSKGGIQAIGFQSITDMYARYGAERADTIMGLCGMLGILRLTCHKTAKYFEERIGSYEVDREYVDESRHSQTSWGPPGFFGSRQTGSVEGSGTHRRRQFLSLPGVLQQELTQLLPVTGRELMIDGFYVLHGRYGRVRYPALSSGLIKPNSSDAHGYDKTRPDDGPNYDPLKPEHAEPRPWKVPEDFQRLSVSIPDGYPGTARPPASTPEQLRIEAQRWRSGAHE